MRRGGILKQGLNPNKYHKQLKEKSMTQQERLKKLFEENAIVVNETDAGVEMISLNTFIRVASELLEEREKEPFSEKSVFDGRLIRKAYQEFADETPHGEARDFFKFLLELSYDSQPPNF